MSKKSRNEVTVCPCGNRTPYDTCCGRYHVSGTAPDPVSLMRSRYSAFVLGNSPYLSMTWHRTTRPESIEFDSRQKWLKLDVIRSAVSQDASEVEFIARFRIGGGSAQRHHEVSRFVLEDGRWFYLDGEVSA